MAQDCGEIRNIRGLSPRPRKFTVVFPLNPRHMRPWCCPAGSRGANRRARCGFGQFFKSWLRIGTTAAFPATWAAFPSRLSAMGPPHAARDADKTAPPPSILGAFLSLPFASHSGATRPLLPRCCPKGAAAWFALAWASAREDDDVRKLLPQGNRLGRQDPGSGKRQDRPPGRWCRDGAFG